MAHLVIPFASNLDDACQAAMKNLSLPHLTKFLKHAQLTQSVDGDEFDFVTAHERGLVADSVVVTPCHWTVGIDNIRLENPVDLQLPDAQSRILFDAIEPYFAQDGLTLEYISAQHWQLGGEALFDLPLASLDRVMGRNIESWLPPLPAGRAIRRLQNEMQMLLYTHPINEEREANALPTVNSFWVSRHFVFDDRFDFSLRESALRGDWQAWAQAWNALDSTITDTTQITLCGERHAKTYALDLTSGMFKRLWQILSPQPNIHAVLQSL
jgi:hypothetical protein